MADDPVLQAQNVYKVFIARGGQARLALRNVNLTVRRGEFLCLIGPSGCGKSTVLNMFAGLVSPSEGVIRHDGRTIVRRKYAGWIRHPGRQPSALAHRVLPTWSWRWSARALRSVERRSRALDYLARVGLKGHEDCIRTSYLVACASAYRSCARWSMTA